MKATVSWRLTRRWGTVWFATLMALGCGGTQEEAQSWSLTLDDGDGWSFVGGPWTQTPDGVMTPPTDPADEHLAFYTSTAFQDFEAEFEFRWNIQNCDAGLIFRAQDARNYYLVHFPCTGQTYRAEHFWAAISKVDDSGWVRFLQERLVPGVPSEIGLWHKIHLRVQDNQFRLKVNGRPLPVVEDDTYDQPGYVGLESFNARDPIQLRPEVGDPLLRTGAGSSFRNLRIRGRPARQPAWNPDLEPVRNRFYPLPETSYGKWQYASSLGRAPNGDLLMKLSVAPDHLEPDAVPVLLRSSDQGRSWSDAERLPDEFRPGTFHTTSNGELALHHIESEPPFRILTSVSSDSGKTWSEWQERDRLRFSESLGVARAHVGKIVTLSDGTLLRFGYAVGGGPSVHGIIREEEGIRYWGPITKADFGFCIRSTDEGMTWSDPVNIDGANPTPGFFMLAKETGSEVSAAETRHGRIVALIRSLTSPWMWETWSEDGGLTWSPAARGPFPMYAATNSMSSTASGTLLIAGRHPGVGVRTSYDDGMTWECTRIDTPFYANGFSYEVEPDVVLYIYNGKYSDPRVRAQLIRVTPLGIEPISVAN